MSTYKIKERGDKSFPSVELKGVRLAEKTIASAADELGICITCDHHPACLFARAARRPVWFCDEFASAEGDRTAAHIERPKAAAEIDQAKAGLLGLCANCDEMEGCMHRVEGVPVLNCEDYK